MCMSLNLTADFVFRAHFDSKNTLLKFLNFITLLKYNRDRQKTSHWYDLSLYGILWYDLSPCGMLW